MKLKPLAWIAAFLIGIGGCVWLYFRHQAGLDADALNEQLRLARAEGIPTTGAEFAATIQPAKPEENAAPLFRQLMSPARELNDFSAAVFEMRLDPGPDKLAAAKKVLRENEAILNLVDQAASKSRCWFDRDWSLGPALVSPELDYVRRAAGLLALRSAVAAADGDERIAIASFREVLTLAHLVGEEGTALSARYAETIRERGFAASAAWRFRHPTSQAYGAAWKEGLEAWPPPDLKRESRDTLFLVLKTIELCETNEGRRRLGVSEAALPEGTYPIALMLRQPKSKIAIVQAERDAWAAFNLPTDQIERSRNEALMRRNMALLAFPTAAKSLADPDSGVLNSFEYVRRWQSYRLMFTAFDRALARGVIAKSIDTSDLLSPYDGKPLTYKFDGKQIRIELDSDDLTKPRTLTVPPDAPKKGVMMAQSAPA